VLGAYLLSVGEMRSCPAFTHAPSSFSYIHPLLSLSVHCLHEFLWSFLKKKGGNLKVETRVGMELIRMRDSNCQSTDFPKKLFLFPNGKLSFLECSEMMCHGIPKQVSRLDDIR
jgi:hypothetical protein